MQDVHFLYVNIFLSSVSYWQLVSAPDLTSSLNQKASVVSEVLLFIHSWRARCTRIYWNSSTGESAPVATALKPSKRFLVMRRSLYLMAATILSSEPWWVLIEYKWQPGTRRGVGVRDGETESTLEMCSAAGAVPWHRPTDQCSRRGQLARDQQRVRSCMFATSKETITILILSYTICIRSD